MRSNNDTHFSIGDISRHFMTVRIPKSPSKHHILHFLYSTVSTFFPKNLYWHYAVLWPPFTWRNRPKGFLPYLCHLYFATTSLERCCFPGGLHFWLAMVIQRHSRHARSSRWSADTAFRPDRREVSRCWRSSPAVLREFLPWERVFHLPPAKNRRKHFPVKHREKNVIRRTVSLVVSTFKFQDVRQTQEESHTFFYIIWTPKEKR